jgi:predicted lipoprotein with Yx(FWY)xxD motif
MTLVTAGSGLSAPKLGRATVRRHERATIHLDLADGVDVGIVPVDSAYLPTVGATVLVNTAGYPLYMFVPNRRRGVTCTGLYVAYWPPLKLAGGGAS